MPISLPAFIRKTLSGDTAAQGYVDLTIAAFSPWIGSNRVVFFPEYTDHGPEHIGGVLRTEEALISDEARAAFASGDAATLVLATLLHDVAMHLTKDGFIALVASNAPPPVQGFGDTPWLTLWEDFKRQASRFDGRKLTQLFGRPEPVAPPEMDSGAVWNDDQYKLVGEFLRRYHPRLAHEIALTGIPGPDPNNRLRLVQVPADVADFAGLVARSHGLPLRRCFDYLREKKRLVHYKNIHAPYLMALLRIGDYLQVEAERAPRQLLQVSKLRSPLSQGEWDMHRATVDVRADEDDPEALYVEVAPPDVKTYLRVKEQLAGIQSELDASWAALGEVYGRQSGTGLDVLGLRGLTLRRVRSNLDDEATFAKTVPYIPTRAEFRTADADLLKLLIKPLYGDRPEIGIRELVANAVDAVRELWEYQKQRPDLANVELIEQEADVVVSLDRDPDGSHWVTVSDRGIGMTADTVRDYFLTAGASFRNSDGWRERFTDEGGSSRVLRTGRFGIGALAAFLLTGQ